jgi:hypothetical protein
MSTLRVANYLKRPFDEIALTPADVERILTVHKVCAVTGLAVGLLQLAIAPDSVAIPYEWGKS